MRLIVLVLWIVTTMVQMSSACKCLVAHIQDQYCNSDFVIKGVVLASKLSSRDTDLPPGSSRGQLREYKVKVKFIYKVPEDTRMRKKIILKSQVDSAACGVQLKLNTTYFLSGSMTPEGMMLSRCSSIAMTREQLNSSQRKFLKKAKDRDPCDCQINYCRGEDCHPKVAHLDECILGYDLRSADCYRKAAFCERNKGMCVWNTEKPFRICIRKL